MNAVQSTKDILNAFEAFRMDPTPLDQYEAIGKDILANKLYGFIKLNKPIEFIMLGFPFKSINTRDKVLGVIPDLGEQLTLNHFYLFNKKIKQFYEPGVSINIASDGYVFNDILNVDDSIVTEYGTISSDMAKQMPIKFLSLKDFYNTRLFEAREKLVQHYGITPEELQKRILMDADVNFLYRGMIRFMNEELAIKKFASGNQLQKAAKTLTKEMMLRNEAYSHLISHEFPNHIRISMHPSINNGAKYSFKLLPGNKAHHSPWHSVIVTDGKEIITMHKIDAENQGYQLIYKDNQPFYYHMQ